MATLRMVDGARLLAQIQQNLLAWRRAWQQAMQRQRGNRWAAQTLAKLKRVPGKPVYPIRWTSRRQRASFFATNGFGQGIPASRSNPPKVTEGWSAEFVPTSDGGILALINPVEHMKYVQGENAQGFHRDTGWVQLDDVEQDFLNQAESAAVTEFFAYDPWEGV